MTQLQIIQSDWDAAAEHLESVGVSRAETIKGTREGRYHAGLARSFAKYRASLTTSDSDGSPEGGDGEAGSVRSTTARAEGIAHPIGEQ